MIKWVWICGVFIFVSAIVEDRNYRIVVDDLNITDVDPEVFLRFDFQLEQIDNRSYCNCTRIFKYDVKDIWVHTEMLFWKVNSQKSIKIMDLKLDVCNILGNIQKNKFLTIFVKNVKEHSNTEVKCPFEANVIHTMNGLYFDEKDFPTSMPLGRFRNVNEFIIRQKQSARVVMKGRIVSK